MDEKYFKIQPSRKDGISERCHTCQESYNHNTYMKNQKVNIERSIKRNQGRKKEVSEYNHNYYMNHQEEFYIKHLKYLSINGGKQKQVLKRWRQEHPEKMKVYNNKHRDHDVNSVEERFMLEIFEFKCAYCGMTLKEHKKKWNEKLHNDHVDDNGYNDLRNDVPACKTCNTSKHTENMEIWFRRQESFTEERLAKIIWWITEGYKEHIEYKPPYRITRTKVNEDNGKYHYIFELWTVDEKRNFIECIETGRKKKDLNQCIKEVFENAIEIIFLC